MEMEKKKFLLNDRLHTNKTHKRWINQIVWGNDLEQGLTSNGVEMRQCFLCQFYVQLTGALGPDWGACTNPVSPFDGKIMFEHNGCDQFSLAEDEEEF